jgi:lysophospholipase L1-like esterase
MRKINKSISLFAASIVTGLVISEIIIRVLWNYHIIQMDNLGVITYEFMRETSDPDVTYELKPNINITYRSYHIVTNKEGFRDDEYAVKKPKNTFRILVLGDSITFGHNIPEAADIYHNVLERTLNKDIEREYPGRRYEVIGIAAPGYDIYTELGILKKKGLKYAPDLVIFGYCLNDMRDSVYSYEYSRCVRLHHSNPSIIKLPSFIRRNLRRSVLYLYLAHTANVFRAHLAAWSSPPPLAVKQKDGAIKPEITPGPLPVSSPHPSTKTGAQPKINFSEDSTWYRIFTDTHRGGYIDIVDKYILNDLEALSRKHGFKVIFVLFPAFERTPSHFPKGEIYAFEEAHATLKQLFEKHGFSVLDLKERLQGYEFDDVAMDTCHLSPKGHYLVARIISDYLNEGHLPSE